MVAMSSDPDWQRVLPAMMLLKMHQRDVAEVEARMQQEQLSVCTDVLRRGMAEGRISPDDDCDVLLMLLVGPLLMSALTGLVPADDAFADRVTDHFLAALGRAAVV
jgi:hypothetical protein